VQGERAGKAKVFPPPEMVFRAFNTCAFARVRVVILGQDPYHAPGQAMGLCFSVPRGSKVPGSLNNMYIELNTDLNLPKPAHGDLHSWCIPPPVTHSSACLVHISLLPTADRVVCETHRAAQGVLLLNTALTVRAHTANSHAGQGWEQFTDAAIKAVSRERRGVVFLLWGNSAKVRGARSACVRCPQCAAPSLTLSLLSLPHWLQKKAALIDSTRHTVLTAAHPSGLSASRGFFGCKHFSQTNAALVQSGLEPIVWQLDL
jgi:uracil-DNA glycosylase